MRTGLVRRARQLLLTVIVLGIVAGAVSAWQNVRAGEGPDWLQQLTGPPPTLAGRHIGIVAGHSGHDSGAVCIDGLTEVTVNEAVADQVVRSLKRRGATVDLLMEFDGRLGGFEADAFVSIHADSCRVDLSGFKVASREGGSAASARLVDCLWSSYEAATELRPHPNTITYDMRSYHAFWEIAPDTPAAIIEIGFLNEDRVMLTSRPERVAAGIVSGIECFLTTTE
jgi:N-acetylmuramoyl-L-alanine amidase